jgi:hypothetical protein
LKIVLAQSLLMAIPVFGQTVPAVPTIPPPTQLPAGPAAPLSAEARQTLQVLHDRKDSLKDFTGKIDYNVEDARSGDATGKRGTIDFVMDAAKGPTFSADFSVNTADGKPKQAYHVQFIFDGRDFTIKDWGLNNNTKQFVHNTLLPPGAKPGDAATLSGAMPLPIGLDVEDVARNFDVTPVTSKDPNEAVIKLVPRDKQRFEYADLTVTLDKKQQLPVKLVQTGANGDITTILLTDLQINTGKAKLADAGTPESQGWRPMAGTQHAPAPQLPPTPGKAGG